MKHETETAHTPCMGTHIFIWGDPASEKKPPEGLECECGMFELRYSTCGCGCGERIMSLRFSNRRSERHASQAVGARVAS